MAETKHTPGPWIAKKGAGWFVTRPDATKRRESAIAVGMTPETSLVSTPSPVSPPWFEDAEAEANARLIAAAPAMLEALKELLQWQRLHLCAEAWAVAEIEALPSVKLARAALRSALGADASTEGAE